MKDSSSWVIKKIKNRCLSPGNSIFTSKLIFSDCGRKILIIDEVGYLPLDMEFFNLLFQLKTKRYEKNFTSF